MSEKIKRMRYFDGMFLGSSDFITEQEYNMRMRRLHNRHLHGSGIVWGLEVSPVVGTYEVRISPGIALDRIFDDRFSESISRELYVNTDITVNLSTGNYPGGEEIYLWIYYHERAADQVEDRGGEELIHWQEEPLVSHSTERPPDEDRYVLLARIVLNQNGVVDDDSILLEESDGSSVRKYSGLSGKRLETDILTLTDPEISESHPWMDARLFTVGSQDKRGIDIFSEHTRLNGDMEVMGSASFHGQVTFDGDTKVEGKLDVMDDAFFRKDIIVYGNANVKLNQDVEGDLTLHGNGTFQNNMSVHGNANVVGNLGVDGNLILKEDGTFQNDATVNGNLLVNGILQVEGRGSTLQNVEINEELVVNQSLIVNGRNNILPAGTVIATMYTEFIPTIGEVVNGWMRANGSVVPPGYKLSGKTTPNLSDSRFLMGSTSPGATGGANTKTLSVTEMPSHKHNVVASISHVGDHNHNVIVTSGSSNHAHSLSGSYTGTESNHYHSAPGRYRSSEKGTVWNNANSYSTQSRGRCVDGSDNEHTDIVLAYTGDGSSHKHSLSGLSVMNGGKHAHSVNQSNNGNHFHTATVTESSMGSSASWDSRPKFLSCIYLIKVD